MGENGGSIRYMNTGGVGFETKENPSPDAEGSYTNQYDQTSEPRPDTEQTAARTFRAWKKVPKIHQRIYDILLAICVVTIIGMIATIGTLGYRLMKKSDPVVKNGDGSKWSDKLVVSNNKTTSTREEFFPRPIVNWNGSGSSIYDLRDQLRKREAKIKDLLIKLDSREAELKKMSEKMSYMKYEKEKGENNKTCLTRTTGGNVDEGTCCVFPFTYKNKIYKECISEDHNSKWCATTWNYDVDEKWGTCDSKIGFEGVPPEPIKISPTESTEPDSEFICKWSANGFDGRGGSEVRIGSQTGNACVAACIEKKKSDSSINGVTTGLRGCYCERRMTRIVASNPWKTCFLAYKGYISRCKSYDSKTGATCKIDGKMMNIEFSHNREQETLSMGHECIHDDVSITYKSDIDLIKSVIRDSNECVQRFFVKSLHVSPRQVMFLTAMGALKISDEQCHNCKSLFLNKGVVIQGYGNFTEKTLLPLKGILIADTGDTAPVEYVKITFMKLLCKKDITIERPSSDIEYLLNPSSGMTSISTTEKTARLTARGYTTQCSKYDSMSGAICKIEGNLMKIEFNHNKEQETLSIGNECVHDDILITYESDVDVIKSVIRESAECIQRFFVESREIYPLQVMILTAEGYLKIYDENCHNCRSLFKNENKIIQGYGNISEKSMLPLKGIMIADTGYVSEYAKITFEKLLCTKNIREFHYSTHKDSVEYQSRILKSLSRNELQTPTTVSGI